MSGKIAIRLLMLQVAAGLVVFGASVMAQTANPKPGITQPGADNPKAGTTAGPKTNPIGSGAKPDTGTTPSTATVLGATLGSSMVHGAKGSAGVSKVGSAGNPKRGTAGGSTIGGSVPSGGGTPPGGGGSGSGGSSGGSGGGGASVTKQLWINNNDKSATGGYMTVRLVAGGTFKFGSPWGETGECTTPPCAWVPADGDTHCLDIVQADASLTDYYIGMREVTRQEFYLVMSSTNTIQPSTGLLPTAPAAADRDLPQQMTYADALVFCTQMSAINSNSTVVPSERQWEKAARAGTVSRYSFTEADYTAQPPAELANYAWYTVNSGAATHNVCLKNPNPLGLYDVYGNVWEWTLTVMEGTSDRVVRGGSCNSPWNACRSATRSHRPENVSTETHFDGAAGPIGLRVVSN